MGLGRVLALFVCLFVPVGAKGQVPARCGIPGNVTLPMVVHWIGTIPEGRILNNISACKIGFQLDSAAIEALNRAKASQAVLDAINQVTAAHLTLEQAHGQVAELEGHITTLGPSASAPFRARIVFLEQSFYPDPRPLTYVRYDADHRQLIASLGGEDYRFDMVPPMAAKTLFENWKQVRASESYTDDEKRSRTLNLASVSITQIGQPLQTATATDNLVMSQTVGGYLDAADKLVKARGYDGAIAQYDLALKTDPKSQPASAGRAKALEYKSRHAAWLKDLIQQGESLDMRSGLMWTSADNGRDLDWDDAGKYCQAMHSGGSSEWRLPSAMELKLIYNPAVSSETFPVQADVPYMDGNKVKTLRKGSYWTYHISNGIVLSAPMVWSGTVLSPGFIQVFPFDDGAPYPEPAKAKIFLRTICVRPWAPAAGSPDAEQLAATSEPEPTGPPGVWTDPATKLTWTLRDNGGDIDWNGAGAYCKALRTADFSDWRLPSPDELAALVDPHSARRTPPLAEDMVAMLNGQPKKYARGTTYPYHIKGEIALTSGNVWTSYKGKPSPTDEAVMLDFQDGTLWQRSNDPSFQRALCVRP